MSAPLHPQAQCLPPVGDISGRYADEPEEFTQGEALTKCESALCFVIGAAAVVVLSFMAVQLWPLVVAAWK